VPPSRGRAARATKQRMRRLLACAVISLSACGDSGSGREQEPPDACAGASCLPTIDASVDAGSDASTCQGADCNDLFVATGGAGTVCSEQAPCARIADALALRSATRTRIHVAAGSYRESVLITGTGEVALLGPASGRVELTPGGDTSVVTVRGDVRVTMSRFDIHGGRGDSFDPLDRNGIVCQLDGRQRPHVILERVLVHHNSGHGFRALSCDLTAERSRFSENDRGGVWIDGAYQIRNSFIVKNGLEGNASSTGGFSISRSPAPSGTFEFNTVGGNFSVGPGAGVNAGTSTGSFRNNVVVGNQPLGTVADGLREAVGGQWAYSIFGGTRIPAGDGNLAVTPTAPTYADDAAGDFSLHAQSRAINAADPAAVNPIDYKGIARPVAGRSDMGADEFVPPL
jgi:hypothetical protein